MNNLNVPPGGGQPPGVHSKEVGNVQGDVRKEQGKMSYSDRLKTNVRYDQRLKRNVLEITLEKTDAEVESDTIGQNAIARVFNTLGIDIKTQVEGYQVHYKGRNSIISVWMAAGVGLVQFCRDVNIKVTENVITGMIRPAGKKDVTVSVSGLDFNTPDNFVIDYMNKFGVVMSNAVVYSKYETGPFQGKYNGERKYQVDFSKSSRHMGTFHLVDGSKVRIFYRGNMKTCGRCHKAANECPGFAMAKNCATGGGERVFLSDHMKKIWGEIGFVPNTFELDDDDKTEDDYQQAAKDAPVINQTSFPPTKKTEPSIRDIENYDGITLRNIPKEVENKDIHAFLLLHGLPEDHILDKVKIKRGDKTCWVIIDGLNPTTVQKMFNGYTFLFIQTEVIWSPPVLQCSQKYDIC